MITKIGLAISIIALLASRTCIYAHNNDEMEYFGIEDEFIEILKAYEDDKLDKLGIKVYESKGHNKIALEVQRISTILTLLESGKISDLIMVGINEKEISKCRRCFEIAKMINKPNMICLISGLTFGIDNLRVIELIESDGQVSAKCYCEIADLKKSKYYAAFNGVLDLNTVIKMQIHVDKGLDRMIVIFY